MQIAQDKLKNLNIKEAFLDYTNIISLCNKNELEDTLQIIVDHLLDQSEIFMFRRLKISYQTLCYADLIIKNTETSSDLKIKIQLGFGKYYLRLGKQSLTYFHYNQAQNLIDEHTKIENIILTYIQSSEACAKFQDSDNALINALIAVQFSDQMILELTSQQAKACALAFFNLAKIKQNENCIEAMNQYKKSYQILLEYFGEKDNLTLHVYHRMYEYEYVLKRQETTETTSGQKQFKKKRLQSAQNLKRNMKSSRQKSVSQNQLLQFINKQRIKYQ